MSKQLKIQKRDLEPTLLNLILNAVQRGNIKLEDLSKSLQDLINQALNSGGAGGSYNDAILVSRINSLQNNKADKTELIDYFNINNKITAGMLDQSVINLITSNTGNTTNLSDYRHNDTKIEYEDLSVPVHNKFTAFETGISSLKTTTEALDNNISTLNAEFAALSGLSGSAVELNNVKNEINAFKTDMNNVSSLVGNIDNQMANFDNELASIRNILLTVPSENNPMTIDSLDTSLADKIKKIQVIEEEVNSWTNTNNIKHGRNGQFAVFVEGSGIANSSMLYIGAISRSAAETTAAIAAGKDYIYDIMANIQYIHNTELDYIDDNIADLINIDTANPTYHYLQNFMNMYMYTHKFIYDDNTGEMIFISNPIIEIRKPNVVITNINIAAGAYYVYTTISPFKQGLKVLVLDQDSASRTYNKYINSEGVATIAYDNNSITIYNDTDANLTFKVCC